MSQVLESPVSLDRSSASDSVQESAPTRTGLRWVLLGLLIVGAGVYAWEEVLEDRVVAKRFGIVEPGLIFRSGQLSEHLVADVLRTNEIEVLVDLTDDRPDDPDQRAEAEAIQKFSIDAHRFPLEGDGTGDPQRYIGALSVIHEAASAGRPVLVHCAAGSQRTGGTICFYRVLVQGQSPEKAYDELQSYDWDPGKDAILLDYVNHNMQTVAEGLVQAGVLAKVPSPLPVVGP